MVKGMALAKESDQFIHFSSRNFEISTLKPTNWTKKDGQAAISCKVMAKYDWANYRYPVEDGYDLAW
jgi:hypothetical protein